MIKLVKKDLKLFIGNKQDMLLTFAIPIIFITLFSFIFGKMGNGDENNVEGIVHVVAGISVMMLLFSVAGLGGSLLDEKQEGMLKKLLCSPMPPNHIFFGKMIFANIIAIAQLSIMFIYAWLVFGLDIMHHIPSLILMIIVIAYACASFGVFLASFAKSRQQVQGYSTIIIMVMSAIGGSMIPLFVMPEIIQKIAIVSVNYWGIQGIYDIFLELLPITDITFLSKVFVLIGIGSLLNIIAIFMFKKNILKIV
jgi:ABC-type multidrug transport system permease subunit